MSNPITLQPGEHVETRRLGASAHDFIYYDYRSPSGRLFSTAAIDLGDARRQRDCWLDDRPERSTGART